MYTIIMNKDKSLIETVKTTLYQREKLVDKIQFLFPQKYEDFSLGEFTATLKYIDQGNVPHSEILVQDEKLYKERIRYVLPIDTNLTQFSGNVTIRITLTKTDVETKTQYVLHTGEVTIAISPLTDWYKFAADDTLEALDKKMLELEAKIEATEKIAEMYDGAKADNLKKVSDNEICLTANGNPIGDVITITSGYNDSDDGEFKVVEF